MFECDWKEKSTQSHTHKPCFNVHFPQKATSFESFEPSQSESASHSQRRLVHAKVLKIACMPRVLYIINKMGLKLKANIYIHTHTQASYIYRICIIYKDQIDG